MNPAPTILTDEVIEIFNDMIVEKWNGRESHFKQKEIVTKIRKKMNIRKTDKIFDEHWLDIEDIYRELGWVVKYESPDMASSGFDEYFVFSKKEKK